MIEKHTCPAVRSSSSLRGLSASLAWLVSLLALPPGGARLEALVITEVMYNPSETPDERPFEYIELYNENADPLDLSNFTVCNGVEYIIPDGTFLEGKSFLVLCANEANIQAKYGITNTLGDWFTSGTAPSLSNGGERIEICNPGGRTVVEVQYNDRGKWPSGADGTGHSIEIISPFVEVDDPDSWMLSNDVGGSPGVANPCWDESAAPPPPGGGGPVGSFTDHIDVGLPCGAGDTTFITATQRYTVVGAGNDIWSGGDQFQYAYVKVNGNFDMRARFVSRTWGPSQWGKGGIMARQDLTSSSRYVFVHDNPEPDAARIAVRPTHGGSDNAEPVILSPGSHPAWLRLTRSGNTITGYHSANGSTWTQFESYTFNWTGGSIVHLGLALTSHANCDTATVVFDQVTISGTILPPDDPGPGPGPGPEPGECVARVPVRLNEAYLRVNGGEDRWLELYNTGTSAVNVGGYYLTNEAANRAKFQIPGGVSIPAKGFLTYTETQLGFSLQVAPPGEPGDRLFIALVEPGPGNRVVDAFNFEPEFTGYSEARIGGDDRAFSPAADPTQGAQNTVSVTTDIVINEVMYHPIDNDDRKEYIELYNRGPVALDLTGFALSDGVNFAIPDGTVIASGGYLVIARDPVLIRSIYGLPAAQVIGPESTPEALDAFGRLRDEGERITLTDSLGRSVDTVRVHDGGEWPRWPDGLGSSLELIDASHDNRRGQAWDASDDSAKATTRSFSYVSRHGNRESELAVLLLSRGIALIDDLQLIGGGVTNTDTVLLQDNLVWKYFKGTEEPPATWTTLGFNDASWLDGQTGIGYGDGDDATNLTDMQDGYMTIFCRRTFSVADTSSVDQLILSLVIDDGFYAYLNGSLVASDNVTSPAFDAAAPLAGEPNSAEYDITAHKGLLVNGTNVLAVQVHNAGLGSSDLSFIPRLIDRTTTVGGGSNLITNGTFNSSSTGWTFDGTHVRSGRTTVGALNGAGSLKVIASGRGDNKMNRIETLDGSGLGAMTANQDVQISFVARWIVGSQTLLTHGYDHELARTHQLMVPLDLGTPGARNSVSLRQAGGNLGPVITNVSHAPVVPSSAQAVTVRATISDPDGVASPTIRYSLNNPSASPASVAMTLVGDNDYEGTIPAQALGAKVIFFIQATDGGGRPGRYPVDVATRTHPLVLNPPAVGINDQRYCIYRHTVENPPTSFHNYRFFMTNTNEQILDGRNRLSNDLVDGSFLFGSSDIYYESQCRFAGSPWARAKWGSMRVRMPRDNPLHGLVERVHLEDHHGNAVNANERISHYLIRQQNQGGVTVPYSDLFTLARWQVNDRIGAVREQVWVPDGDFLQRWYPGDDEGDFIEMDDRFLIDDGGNRTNSADGRVLYPPPYGTNDSNGANEENYRWFFGLRAKNGADEIANFIAYARVMDPARTNDTSFDQQIWDYANVEELLRIWAVQLNIDDWDSWGANRGKNLYFYRPEATGLWEILSWDLELTYGNVNTFLIPTTPTSTFNPGAFAEVNRLFNRPKIKRMYYSILDEMVNGSSRWFHSSYLAPYAQRLAELGMANTGTAQPGGYIDQRASLLQQRISSVVYPSVRLQISSPNGGNNFSTPSVATNFAGTAPTEICEIVVDRNGEQETYPVTYTSMTAWSMPNVPLVPGANALTLIGFDLRGNPIDSDTITITSTSSWEAPIIDLITPDSSAPGTNVEIYGTDFHNGLRVFFGAVESPNVTFSEADPPPARIIARVPSGAGTVDVTVRNLDLQTSNPLSFTFIAPPPMFIRGDANGDLVIDISDGVKVLRHLYASVTTDCEDSLDADDNETLNVTDAIRIFNYVVQNGPPPNAPFPAAGTDPSGTDLGCNR